VTGLEHATLDEFKHSIASRLCKNKFLIKSWYEHLSSRGQIEKPVAFAYGTLSVNIPSSPTTHPT
jgi:hypothetical protein